MAIAVASNEAQSPHWFLTNPLEEEWAMGCLSPYYVYFVDYNSISLPQFITITTRFVRLFAFWADKYSRNDLKISHIHAKMLSFYRQVDTPVLLVFVVVV